MSKSAGILLYRMRRETEFFLVHMGGPFWKRKDEGAWSIPKGLAETGEASLAAAMREFREETGFVLSGDATELGDFKIASGKILTAFAMEGDCDPGALSSNTFELEWPPRSGKRTEFPEADRAAWFSFEEAWRKIVPKQRAVLEAFVARRKAG